VAIASGCKPDTHAVNTEGSTPSTTTNFKDIMSENEHDCDDHPVMQQISARGTSSLQECLNNETIVRAFATLMAAGLLFTPTLATVFCAYCGEHICFDARQMGDRAMKPVTRQSDYTRNAVQEHRKTCLTYQSSTDSGIAKELALIREAAQDSTLSDAAVRAVASGLQPPTADDIEWATQSVSSKAERQNDTL
jgi:hypothetical protein